MTFDDKDDLHGTVFEVTWLQSGWQKDWETSPPENWMDIPWRQTLQESWKPYQKDDYIMVIYLFQRLYNFRNLLHMFDILYIDDSLV